MSFLEKANEQRVKRRAKCLKLRLVLSTNSLLNDAIGMAIRLVEKHGSHIPFCMAVTTAGERTSIAADDSKMPGADALLAGIRQHITDALRDKRYRAIALARNVEYRSARDGSRTDAVQVILDHEQGSPVTCYLPYQLAQGRVVSGQLFAVQAEERFFAHAASYDGSSVKH
jgi:hypothetical protein